LPNDIPAFESLNDTLTFEIASVCWDL